MVRLRDVVGIFDIQTQDRESTASFLNRNKTTQQVEIVEVGDVKSFVVTNNRLYFSPISSLTLKKRAQNMDIRGKAELE